MRVCITHHICDCHQEMLESLHAENEELKWFRDQINQRVLPGESDTQDAAFELIRSMQTRLADTEEVLKLIAAPKRPDGTYNRSREACEQLARECLDRIAQKTPRQPKNKNKVSGPYGI